MFQKRDDRLQQLNDELLAEEEEYIDQYEDEDLDEADLAELLGEEEDGDELLYRNHANYYGKGSPVFFDDEEFADEEELDDQEFLYQNDYKQAKKAKKKADKANRKDKRKKLGLAIIALVELIAIVGIIAWWASWVL